VDEGILIDIPRGLGLGMGAMKNLRQRMIHTVYYKFYTSHSVIMLYCRQTYYMVRPRKVSHYHGSLLNRIKTLNKG